jgi:hypothetical protein
MSYRPGLPNVLKGLSFEVGAADKIGGEQDCFRNRHQLRVF